MEGRVLIVDRSRAQAAALAGAISREGYVTRCVRRAGEAIRRVAGTSRPDIVLMDLSLLDMDWEQALRALKAQAHPGFLPVVLLSARVDLALRVSALRTGADDFVGRPFHPDEISARVAAMLRIKSSQDALALANRQLEQQTITDPLTSLFNRRYFQYRAQQELERSRRHGAPVSLLVLDLDHFKRVNDRYGHPAGDEALCRTGQLLKSELRRLDVCARWGGEEFAVLMPSTGRLGAMTVARRILRAVRTKTCFEAAPVGAPDARLEAVRLTTSIGLASHPSPGIDTAEQLFAAADAALYRAKRSGRDQLRTHAEPEPASTVRATLTARAAYA